MLDTLAAAPSLGPQRALQLLLAKPTLLSNRPELLARRWGALHAAAARNAAWEQQLAGARPGSVGSWLLAGPVRWRQVCFLLECIPSASKCPAFSRALTATPSEFCSRHPSYEAWQPGPGVEELLCAWDPGQRSRRR